MADSTLSKTLSIIIPELLKATNETLIVVVSAFTKNIKPLWIEYGNYLIIFVLIFCIIKFFEKGIGSIIYHVIYLSIVAAIIIFFGWGVIFNNWFNISVLLAYLISFKLTKYILLKIRIWKK